MASAVYMPNLEGTEEAALIRRILDGERELFAGLIAPHLTPLMRTVRANIGSHPDVEDIVQQTVLKAFSRLERFRFEASFRTWLIGIGLNEARQWRRKCATSRFVTLDLPTLTQLPAPTESESPWAECERSEAAVRLRAALARMPDKYRMIILLRDLEDLSLSEIAERLGLTVGAVRTRHWRARRIMAKCLGRLSQSHPRLRPCR
ncbi:MAG: polymerase, sigma-24 subunit, subfamily [Bryobacterales bacterium]|jgi:RNA polymerase sigma factor (sigma-70 family)|nr:polymerase, sigma-24 subunit, subfamily [Bryobacterales bacterium]